MKIALVLIAMLLQATLWTTPAGAQARVSVTVDAGYEGYYSTQNPTPVRVRLANQGESFRARVELTAPVQNGSIVYYSEVELPHNSAKLLTLYPQYGGFAANAQVRVIDGKQLVARGEDKLTQVAGGTRLFGLLTPDAAPYAALISREAGAESVVARLTAETLPERADALGAVDTLVVDGVDTGALSKAQTAALGDWVQLGGTLIVAAGPDAARNAAGIGNLMPVTLGAQSNAQDLSALAKLGGSQIPAGGVITQATPGNDTRVVASSPDGPLVVRRATGQGSIAWLAWSPSAPPFREWPGNAALIRSTSAQPSTAASQGVPVDGWAVENFLRNIAGAELPPTLLVAGFLIVYSLVIGPVLYLILKRRDRRELAWVLVPAITLAFSGIAYGANFLIRGTGTTMRTLDVVETYGQGGAQRVTTYAGLFSTNRRDYDLALAPGYTVRGPNPDNMDMQFDPNGNPVAPGGGPMYTVETGEQSVLRDVQVDVYALRTFAAQRVENGGSLAIEATLSGNGSNISGTVRNTSAVPLDQVYVVSQDGIESIGAVQPGQSAKVTGNSEQNFNGFEGNRPPKDWDKRQIVQNMYERMSMGGPDGMGQPLPADEALVLAWHKSTDQPVRVLDAKAELSGERLVILHSRTEIRPGAVNLEIPAISSAGTRNPGEIEFEYRIPTGVTAETMSLSIDPLWQEQAQGGMMPPDMGGPVGPAAVPGFAAPTIALVPGTNAPAEANGIDLPEIGITLKVAAIQDQNSGGYTPLSLTRQAPEVTAVIPNPSRHIGRNGKVLIRIVSTNDAPLTTQMFELKVTGRKR